MQYSAKDESAVLEGNALRNFRKLVNSGVIQRIINYYRRPTQKPLEITLPHGNPNDAYVLLTSIAAQQWRKRVAEENRIPKGHTKSPKLGARNLAFSKGLNPTEPTDYFTLGRGNIILEREGAGLIVEAVHEYGYQFPELGVLL